MDAPQEVTTIKSLQRTWRLLGPEGIYFRGVSALKMPSTNGVRNVKRLSCRTNSELLRNMACQTHHFQYAR